MTHLDLFLKQNNEDAIAKMAVFYIILWAIYDKELVKTETRPWVAAMDTLASAVGLSEPLCRAITTIWRFDLHVSLNNVDRKDKGLNDRDSVIMWMMEAPRDSVQFRVLFGWLNEYDGQKGIKRQDWLVIVLAADDSSWITGDDVLMKMAADLDIHGTMRRLVEMRRFSEAVLVYWTYEKYMRIDRCSIDVMCNITKALAEESLLSALRWIRRHTTGEESEKRGQCLRVLKEMGKDQADYYSKISFTAEERKLLDASD